MDASFSGIAPAAATSVSPDAEENSNYRQLSGVSLPSRWRRNTAPSIPAFAAAATGQADHVDDRKPEFGFARYVCQLIMPNTLTSQTSAYGYLQRPLHCYEHHPATQPERKSAKGPLHLAGKVGKRNIAGFRPPSASWQSGKR